MVAETALKLVETNDVENKALTIVEQAKAVQVTDAESYTAAGEMWKQIRDMMKEVEDTFNPIIEQSHRAHKTALAQKAKFFKPLEDAQKSVKALMSRYDEEQERIRLAEQRRMEEEARKAEEARRAEELAILEAERKAEEERLLAAAAEAEAAGKTDQAAELLNIAEERSQEIEQAAQAIKTEPVYVPPVVAPKTTPKLEGGPVYQTRWKHQVVNFMDLVRAVAAGKAPTAALQANDVFLGQQARSLKEQMNIPGVRAYSERV